MKRCKVCQHLIQVESPILEWCGNCFQSWERLPENGSIVTVANWAARRARISQKSMLTKKPS